MNFDAIFSQTRGYPIPEDTQASHVAAINAKVWKLIKENQKVIDKCVTEVTSLQDQLEAAEKRLLESLGEEKRLLMSLEIKNTNLTIEEVQEAVV